MDGLLVEHFINERGIEVLVLEFRPPLPDVIIKCQNQWKELPDGTIRTWFRRSQYEECVQLAGMVEGEYA